MHGFFDESQRCGLSIWSPDYGNLPVVADLLVRNYGEKKSCAAAVLAQPAAGAASRSAAAPGGGDGNGTLLVPPAFSHTQMNLSDSIDVDPNLT